MTQISVELTLYPLADEFIPPIADFIDRLNQYPELTIQTNCMSTQVFGDYARTLAILAEEMEKTHTRVPRASFVMKVLRGNLLTGGATD